MEVEKRSELEITGGSREKVGTRKDKERGCRMGKGIEGLEQAYEILFTAILIFLAVLALLCLLRAVIGPKTADRIVAVNMLGTMVIVMIAVLTLMLQEDYLADICVIYAMISFLAVIVLTKVYMGVYLERKKIAEMSGETKSGEYTAGDEPGKCDGNDKAEK